MLAVTQVSEQTLRTIRTSFPEPREDWELARHHAPSCALSDCCRPAVGCCHPILRLYPVLLALVVAGLTVWAMTEDTCCTRTGVLLMLHVGAPVVRVGNQLEHSNLKRQPHLDAVSTLAVAPAHTSGPLGPLPKKLCLQLFPDKEAVAVGLVKGTVWRLWEWQRFSRSHNSHSDDRHGGRGSVRPTGRGIGPSGTRCSGQFSNTRWDSCKLTS